jgi:hypothetical protein
VSRLSEAGVPHQLEQRRRAVSTPAGSRDRRLSLIAADGPIFGRPRITMANKFDIPSLRQACITFLLPSAAGRPTLGLRIAEENNM